MRVLFVTAEAYPLAKTGGLADVSRALPIALMGRGVDIHLLIPGYPGAFTRVEKPRFVAKLDPILGVSDGMLVSGTVPDTELPVWLVDAPSLYRRTGSLYQDENGQDWPDNALRFAYLSHVAAKLAMGRTKLAWRPDVVHANDWHAGLLPLLLSMETAPRPRSVFTTHNMAFQGNFPATALPIVDVPQDDFTTDGFEFYGQVSFLKAGLRYADRVTTVSPNYAKEILTAEFGCGMEGVLQARAGNFSGILNGIDDGLWDPATDYHLPQNYRASDISGKRVCKTALQRELGLPVSAETPLIGFVSRFTQQKMADVILEAIPWIVERGAQFALVGEGDPALEAAFAKLQAPGVSVTIGYEEPLAHRLQAGSDILLAPARFEPCGLTQLYGLRYGALPVVRRTGGLADTVVNTNSSTLADRTATGFVFEEADLPSLVDAIGRALALYDEPLAWRRLQLQAMAQNFSWDASAEKYLALYHAASGIPLLQTAERSQAGQVPGRQAAVGAV